MAGTVQHLVRNGIVTALAALPALEDVNVSYAWEFGDASQVRERIFTNRARANTPPAALKAGRNHRDETATFELVVWVEGVGLSSYETDARAGELAQVVEEWLADNKAGTALAITGLNWLRAESWECHNLGNDQGSLTELSLSVTYNARLT